MALFASVNNVRAVECAILIPRYGLWTADIKLDTATDLAGNVTLILGGLTLKGHVFRASAYQGAVRARIVAGAGGWQKTLKARSYQHDAGVKLSNVVTDAANECGEKVTITKDKTVGPNFVRPEDQAGHVLNMLAPRGFFAGDDGIVTVGDRATGAVKSQFVTQNYNGATGIVTVASDFPQDWKPDKTFSSPTIGQKLISSVYHVAKGSSLRTELTISP